MKAVTKILLSGGKKNEDGREINEDRIKTFTINKNEMEYFYAIIMDGATGLGKNNQIEKNKTSAEWYVDFVIEYLEKYFRKNPEEKIEKVVKGFDELNKLGMKYIHYKFFFDIMIKILIFSIICMIIR